jgi:hypothetical protein
MQHGPGVARAGRGGELGVGMIAGPGILHQTWDAVKSRADIQSERVKMAAAGIPQEEIERAGKQATEIASRVPTTKIPKALEDYKDLRSVLQDREEAAKLLEETRNVPAHL